MSREAGGAAASSDSATEPQRHQEDGNQGVASGRTPLERTADAAEELYRLRDTFFPRDPAEKAAALRARADDALAVLDSLPPEQRKTPQQRAVYEFLRGKIFNVFPDYHKEAEDHLSKADKDETMKCNPDLYYNCATADKYLENYERALRGFEAAALKDPGLGADTEVQKIISLLDKLDSVMKGQLRFKRLASSVSSLSEVNIKSSHKKATIGILSEGLNKTVAVLGKVVLSIRHDNVAPMYYLTCDLDQSYFILSVYGLRNEAIKEGDRVALLDPFYRILDISWKEQVRNFKLFIFFSKDFIFDPYLGSANVCCQKGRTIE
uniref:Tetratricopeptide repeat protein 5 OB fold domain-containing protein n=1 Tax=Leersia perrieri TaxID=77586 RepID=A0A0D9V1E0_9ORYZ